MTLTGFFNVIEQFLAMTKQKSSQFQMWTRADQQQLYDIMEALMTRMVEVTKHRDDLMRVMAVETHRRGGLWEMDLAAELKDLTYQQQLQFSIDRKTGKMTSVLNPIGHIILPNGEVVAPFPPMDGPPVPLAPPAPHDLD